MSATRRVGIVGGSIGGCAAAVCLSRAGWDVELFERSERELVSRGAGIVTLTALLDALVERDLIGAELRRFDAPPMRWVGRDAESPSGRVLGTDPVRLPSSALMWGDLYTQLRARVPPGAYVRGRTVAEIEHDDLRPSLRLSDGRRRHYDLVVCADGYRSLGRSTLFPEVALGYRGYVLWRGLVPRDVLNGSDVLEAGGVRCAYRGGHGVFYLVPSSRSGLDGAAVDVNWGLYLQVPESELAVLSTDRLGRASDGSVAPGMLPPDRESGLKARAAEVLPDVFANVVDASRDTFVQAIYSVTVPSYHRGRVCLVGDAGTLHPPFTGSGVFKAIGNALELAERLGAESDVDRAIAAWSDRQLRNAATFEAAAATFERALVVDVPDLAAFDDAAFAAWHGDVWADVPPSPARAAVPANDAHAQPGGSSSEAV